MATRTGTYYTGNVRGQVGSLLTAIRAICVTGEGWTEEFTGTNRAIFRPPAGSRFRLRVVDDGSGAAGAREATVRAAEGATGINTLIDPFPTVALQSDANCVWRKSETADATDRPYYAVADDRFLLLVIYTGTFERDVYFFGDLVPTYPGDTYCVGLSIRRTGNDATSGIALDGRQPGVAQTGLAGVYMARTEDGALKSPTAAHFRIMNTTLFGATGAADVGTYPHARTNDLLLQQSMLITTGGTSAGVLTSGGGYRAYIPYLFEPMLGTSVSSLEAFDTFTDTAYDASSQFIILPEFGLFSVTNFNGNNVVLQTAGTWKTPTF